jgi:hypothetical protein
LSGQSALAVSGQPNRSGPDLYQDRVPLDASLLERNAIGKCLDIGGETQGFGDDRIQFFMSRSGPQLLLVLAIQPNWLVRYYIRDDGQEQTCQDAARGAAEASGPKDSPAGDRSLALAVSAEFRGFDARRCRVRCRRRCWPSGGGATGWARSRG